MLIAIVAYSRPDFWYLYLNTGYSMHLISFFHMGEEKVWEIECGFGVYCEPTNFGKPALQTRSRFSRRSKLAAPPIAVVFNKNWQRQHKKSSHRT